MVRTELGRFVKGVRSSLKTEFKKGQHWREHKPFWDRDWLYNEYIVKERSMGDIAADFNLTEPAIRFWARKHNIPTRTTSEARSIKYWGLPGEKNGMYGKRGEDTPNWRGGLTPARQALYSSIEWANVVKMVWKRDNSTCQRCKAKKKHGVPYHIHHKKTFADESIRLEPSNLILVCRKCHIFIHSKKNVDREFINE
jgi:hypothetical protein